MEGVAILAPSGNDTTGAVGTSTTPPSPYATTQEAINDGAKALILMPKNGSYGNISVSSNLLLTIFSHGYGNSANQIGSVSTNGFALALYVSSARETLTIGSISTKVAGSNSGQAILRNVWCLAQTITEGVDATSPGQSGFNGGTLNAEDCRFGLAVSTNGGTGMSGDSLQAGGGGGQAGEIIAKRCRFDSSVSHSGSNGGVGGAGDSETESPAGGAGGAAGPATFEDCVFASEVTGNGGAGGNCGEDGGGGFGSHGDGGEAATASMIRCTGEPQVNLIGGVSSGTVGSGGNLTLVESYVGNIETPNGNAEASGSFNAKYSSFGTTTNTATTSGQFVVANGSPEVTGGA